MEARQIPRRIRRSVTSDEDLVATTSSNVKIFSWRDRKIIMDDEKTMLQALPNLRTMFCTRSSASTIMEAAIIIHGADYNTRENDEKKDAMDKEDDPTPSKSIPHSPMTQTSFQVVTNCDRLYKPRRKSGLQSIGISSLESKTYEKEGFRPRAADVGVEILDPDQIWSSIAMVKVLQRRSDMLVKISFNDVMGVSSHHRHHRHRYHLRKKTACGSPLKRATCTVDLVLEEPPTHRPDRGLEEGIEEEGIWEKEGPNNSRRRRKRSICSHYWPVTVGVHTLMVFELRIHYYQVDDDDDDS